MNKRFLLFLAIGFLALGIGLLIFFMKPDTSQKITFEECENAGGVAWRVDLYHPDICSSCAEYQACLDKNKGASNVRDLCPQFAACSECLESNFPYPARCPDGREKLGEISDAATWFQCCK
jgi:hypothetical protein